MDYSTTALWTIPYFDLGDYFNIFRREVKKTFYFNQLDPDLSAQSRNTLIWDWTTVDSRYLELGHLEFCETQSVCLYRKYILIAFSNHNLVLETFLQVQITRSAN